MKYLKYVVLVLLVIFFSPFFTFLNSGCSKSATQPRWDATNTFTKTPTFTITSTAPPTQTPTYTNTATITNTPGSPTSTNTPTSTPTDTPTTNPSYTATYTPTVTETPTVSNTPTSTPTISSLDFTFSSAASITGWYYNASGSVGGGVTTTAAVGFDGTASCPPNSGALAVTIAFTGVNQQVNIQYATGSVINLAGKAVSAVVKVPSGFNTNNPQGGHLYAQNGSPNWLFYKDPTYQNLGPGCVTLTMNVPATITAVTGGNFDPSQVVLIGLELDSNASGSTTQTVVDVFNWLSQ